MTLRSSTKATGLPPSSTDEREPTNEELLTGAAQLEQQQLASPADSSRRRANAALKKSELGLRTLVENISSAVALVDENGRFTLFNQRFLTLFGLSSDSDIKNVNDTDWSAWQVFDAGGKLLNVDEHPVRKAALTRQPVCNQLVGVRLPVGVDLTWMLVSASPILAEDGSVGGLICTYHDTTELRCAEEALRESEERYRGLFETMSEAFSLDEIVYDEAGQPCDLRFLKVNPAFERQTGLRAADVVCRTSREVFGRAEPLWLERYSKVVSTGEADHFEACFGPLGRHFEVSAYRTGGGHLAVISHDVTERKRTEEALRITLRRFYATLSGLNGAVLLVSNEGCVEFANQAFCETFGLSARPDELKGLTASEMMERIRPAYVDSEAAVARIRQIVARGQPVRNEEVELRGERTCLRDFVPIMLEGRAFGRMWHHFDITDRKVAEHALREADRRRTEFLGMLSHELRNPLTPIRNSLYILDRAAPGGDQARRAHTVIDRQVNHLARLVDDLLDVTRITRGKIRLQRSRLDLVEVVRRTVDDHRTLLEDHQLDVALPKEPLWVAGDATRLAQIVGNLVANAAKFTPDDERISVSLMRVDTRAVIEVSDSGIGMEPETLKRLFEPFSQGDRGLDRSRGGLGLGLAIVKGMVELHDGQVYAHSDGPGRGACFTITLPLDLDMATAEVGAQPQRAGIGRSVLVIEDNRDAAESLAEVLVLAGHQVSVAFDGKSGLAKALAQCPDVILCDIGLPGHMDGYAVARALRDDGRTAPCFLVALTGYAQPEDHRRALDSGFNAHLAKPPDLVALERLLQERDAARV